MLNEDHAVLGAAILGFDCSYYTECCLEEYDAILFIFFQNVCKFLPYHIESHFRRCYFSRLLWLISKYQEWPYLSPKAF